MDASGFNEPRIALNRVYTRRGDKGQTSLVGGQRVPKDDLRIECFGTVDELNACIGLACVHAVMDGRLKQLADILKRVQHELFNLGSVLATMPEDVGPKQPRITAVEIELLEREIDEMNAALPPLRSFVLPGGTELNARLHLCRTICRRAERMAVRLFQQGGSTPFAVEYLNRLSDALFVWSRWTNLQLDIPEVLWSPNEAASARPR